MSTPSSSLARPTALPFKYRRKSFTPSDFDEPVAASSSPEYPSDFSASSSPIESSVVLSSSPSSSVDHGRIRYQSSPIRGLDIHARDDEDMDSYWSSHPKALKSGYYYAGYAEASSSFVPSFSARYSYSSPSETSEAIFPSDIEMDQSEGSEYVAPDNDDDDMSEDDYSSHSRRISFSTSAERDTPFTRPALRSRPYLPSTSERPMTANPVFSGAPIGAPEARSRSLELRQPRGGTAEGQGAHPPRKSVPRAFPAPPSSSRSPIASLAPPPSSSPVSSLSFLPPSDPPSSPMMALAGPSGAHSHASSSVGSPGPTSPLPTAASTSPGVVSRTSLLFLLNPAPSPTLKSAPLPPAVSLSVDVSAITVAVKVSATTPTSSIAPRFPLSDPPAEVSAIDPKDEELAAERFDLDVSLSVEDHIDIDVDEQDEQLPAPSDDAPEEVLPTALSPLTDSRSPSPLPPSSPPRRSPSLAPDVLSLSSLAPSRAPSCKLPSEGSDLRASSPLSPAPSSPLLSPQTVDRNTSADVIADLFPSDDTIVPSEPTPAPEVKHELNVDALSLLSDDEVVDSSRSSSPMPSPVRPRKKRKLSHKLEDKVSTRKPVSKACDRAKSSPMDDISMELDLPAESSKDAQKRVVKAAKKTARETSAKPTKPNDVQSNTMKRKSRMVLSDSESDAEPEVAPNARAKSKGKERDTGSDEEQRVECKPAKRKSARPESDRSVKSKPKPTSRPVSKPRVDAYDSSDSDEPTTPVEKTPTVKPPVAAPDLPPPPASFGPLPYAEMQGLLIETLATSRASSQTCVALHRMIMASRPALREGDLARDEWVAAIEAALEDGRRRCGVFDKVQNKGKDSHDHHVLEARWFYVPENDLDQERATFIRSIMPRPAKRNETKKAKQYYWRPLGKMSRWDPEDDL